MRRTDAGIAFVLVAFAAVAPALAAQDACVQKNRIFSTSVIDSKTVLVTDKDKRQYTVHMRGSCVGLDSSAEHLSFRTKLELGCLTSGDSISYNLPGERTPVTVRGSLQTPCFIDSVTAGAPQSAH